MAYHLPPTHDNNIADPLPLTDAQRNALLCLSGKTLKTLVDKDTGRNFLVFPQDLAQYGDNMGDDVLFEIVSDKLFTGNLMGFVGCNGHMLKIGSRFDMGRKDNFMHYMLERVLSISLFDLNYNTDKEGIFDFLPFLFPHYLERALSRGIFKEYRTYRRNDPHMRGVLDVNRHIRFNYPMTGNIAYKARERTCDNATMQLIRHAIEVIHKKEFGNGILNCNEIIKEYVSQVRTATSSYNMSERERVIYDNLRSKVHPYYSEYEPLRVLCLQILRNEEIKYGFDDDTVSGIIFDGAWLWEEYLYTVISSCGIRHPRNKIGDGGIYLFKDRKGLRFPDFIGNGIVLDAKYKGYERVEMQNINREDLHQMITYMYITRSRTGVILFPKRSDGVSIDNKALEGYGGTIQLLGLPISSKLDYKEFKADMLLNECCCRNAITSIMTGDKPDMA